MTSQTIVRTTLGIITIVIFSLGMSSCLTTQSQDAGKTLPASRMKSNAVLKRNQVIQMEEPGNYWVGRRWYTEGTRYWGYVRKPGRPWEESKLIVMNESRCLQPDRVHETPADGGPAHGFDHNWEYRLYGNFTGQKVYDPNSNLELPEFLLQRYELANRSPGFLFYPGEPYQKRGLPPKHPPTP